MTASVTLGLRQRFVAADTVPFVVDAHCHIFNALDFPIAGFIEAYAAGALHLPVLGFMRTLIGDFEAALIRVAKAASAADHAGAKAAARAAFKKLAQVLPSDLEWAKEFENAIDTATMTHQQIAESVAKMYGSVDLFLACLVDFDGWTPEGTRPPENGLDERIAQHEAVALGFMKGTAKARFHPFVSFNPRRDGALDKVKDAIENHGFVGVKLYPPCGFSASGNAALASLPDGATLDQRLADLFRYCESEAVPVLAHAGPANAFRRGAEFRASPLSWEDTLERFPYLRLNLGHFGHDRGLVEGCPNVECLVWAMEIASLMDRYDNVYADISDSALGYDPDYQKRYLPMLNDVFARYGKTKGRVLYGSDWWMNEFEGSPERYYDNVRDIFQAHFPERLDDFMGGNALRFLGFRKQDGTVNDCNPNWQRLVKYYKKSGCKKPGWLGEDKDDVPLLCLKPSKWT